MLKRGVSKVLPSGSILKRDYRFRYRSFLSTSRPESHGMSELVDGLRWGLFGGFNFVTRTIRLRPYLMLGRGLVEDRSLGL